jgi:hypothetical protein
MAELKASKFITSRLSPDVEAVSAFSRLKAVSLN